MTNNSELQVEEDLKSVWLIDPGHKAKRSRRSRKIDGTLDLSASLAVKTFSLATRDAKVAFTWSKT